MPLIPALERQKLTDLCLKPALSIEIVSGQLNLVNERQKASEDILRGPCSSPSKQKNLAASVPVVLALELRIEERSYGICL